MWLVQYRLRHRCNTQALHAGGEVEGSQLTAMHSRDALELTADRLAHAADTAAVQGPVGDM